MGERKKTSASIFNSAADGGKRENITIHNETMAYSSYVVTA